MPPAPPAPAAPTGRRSPAPTRPGRRRPLLRALTLGLAAALAPAATVAAAAGGVAVGPVAPARSAVPVVVIAGRGHGHGVGMAQDGALWLARSGRSAPQILQLFYPGTKAERRAGLVRVPVAAASSLTLMVPDGGSLAEHGLAAGAEVRVAARDGTLRATWTGEELPVPRSDVSAGGRRAGARRPSGESALVLPGGRRVAVARISTAESVDTTSTSTTATAFAPAGSAGPDTVPADPMAAGLEVFTPVEPSGSSGSPGPEGAADTEPSDPAAGGPSAPPDGATDTSRPGTGPGDEALDTDSPETGDTVPGQRLLEGATLRLRAADGGVVALGGRRFRGAIELRLQAGGVKAVNELDVEDYLRGMGEIRDNGWPAAALQAQAVAARTYALRTMATAGEVCPTQRCQVYLGQQAEYPDMDAAVRATAGQVLTYKGALAATFYSASGGGTIATPEEAFGTGAPPIPYLVAGAYPTGDLRAWEVRVGLDQLARRVGYGGRPRGVEVSEVGPSGRAVTVTIDGSSGPLRLAGPRFDAALGLLSTYFTLRLEEAAAAPVDTLPPAGSADDPDAAAALGQESLLAEPAEAAPAAALPAANPAANPVATGPSRSSAPTALDGAPALGRTAAAAAVPAVPGLPATPPGSSRALDVALLVGGAGALGGAVAIARRHGRRRRPPAGRETP